MRLPINKPTLNDTRTMTYPVFCVFRIRFVILKYGFVLYVDSRTLNIVMMMNRVLITCMEQAK